MFCNGKQNHHSNRMIWLLFNGMHQLLHWIKILFAITLFVPAKATIMINNFHKENQKHFIILFRLLWSLSSICFAIKRCFCSHRNMKIKTKAVILSCVSHQFMLDAKCLSSSYIFRFRPIWVFLLCITLSVLICKRICVLHSRYVFLARWQTTYYDYDKLILLSFKQWYAFQF